MTTDVYSQYFAADCIFCGVARHAALVSLTVDSEGGRVSYSVSASFFPHTDEDDFSVSYDAFVSKIVYEGVGRRSKKRPAMKCQLGDRDLIAFSASFETSTSGGKTGT